MLLEHLKGFPIPKSSRQRMYTEMRGEIDADPIRGSS
jgi:hypothetical protein